MMFTYAQIRQIQQTKRRQAAILRAFATINFIGYCLMALVFVGCLVCAVFNIPLKEMLGK